MGALTPIVALRLREQITPCCCEYPLVGIAVVLLASIGMCDQLVRQTIVHMSHLSSVLLHRGIGLAIEFIQIVTILCCVSWSFMPLSVHAQSEGAKMGPPKPEA